MVADPVNDTFEGRCLRFCSMHAFVVYVLMRQSNRTKNGRVVSFPRAHAQRQRYDDHRHPVLRHPH